MKLNKHSHGFHWSYFLIVIAIIIWAGITLVFLNNKAVDKATSQLDEASSISKKLEIRSYLGGFVVEAESYYSDNSSYTNIFTINGICSSNDVDLNIFLTKLNTNSDAGKTVCNANATAYAISVKLPGNSSVNSYMCVDSAGKSPVEYSSALVAGAVTCN